MAKRSKIRWTNEREQELKRSLRNYNAKIDRLSKKPEYQNVDLPEKMGLKQAREKYKEGTLMGFRRDMEDYQRFTQSNYMEKIVVHEDSIITRWERDRFIENVEKMNETRQRRRKKYDISFEAGNFDQLGKQGLEPRNPHNAKTIGDIRALTEVALKETEKGYETRRDLKFKDQYLKALEKRLGEKGKKIRDIVVEMRADKVYKYSIETPILGIKMFYDKHVDDSVLELYSGMMWEIFAKR